MSRNCHILGISAFYHDRLIPAVAYRLAEGRIVGWVQGRMEFGPRALGGRSILADPRNPETPSIITGT